MKSLSEVVKNLFPNETIITEAKVQLQDSWKNKIGAFPVSYGKYFYFKPMDMIETDNKFYFDRRQPFLFQSQISSLVTPLVITVVLFVLLYYFLHTPINYSLPISLFALILWEFFVAINIPINQGLANILTIKKDWIKTIEEKDERKIIEGEIPEGNLYSIIFFLSPEEQKKLSFLDKFFGGVYFKALNNLSVSANFTLIVKKL